MFKIHISLQLIVIDNTAEGLSFLSVFESFHLKFALCSFYPELLSVSAHYLYESVSALITVCLFGNGISQIMEVKLA